eukprot:2051848-Pyramimonas_sp.AAC.1
MEDFVVVASRAPKQARRRPPGRSRRASLNEGDLLIGHGRCTMSNQGVPGPRKLNSGLGRASAASRGPISLWAAA